MLSLETYFAIWNALTVYHHTYILIGVFMINFLLNLWVLQRRIVPSVISSIILVSLLAVFFIIVYLRS